MINKTDDFNNVPVEYCTKCISLKILEIKHPNTGEMVPYCGSCGSAKIEKGHISEFEQKYRNLYGEEHLTRDKSLEK